VNGNHDIDLGIKVKPEAGPKILDLRIFIKGKCFRRYPDSSGESGKIPQLGI